MGKWINKLQAHIGAADQVSMDDEMRSALAWLVKWRGEGRFVQIAGNDVLVENWHTLSQEAKDCLHDLQPHLAAALVLERAGR